MIWKGQKKLRRIYLSPLPPLVQLSIDDFFTLKIFFSDLKQMSRVQKTRLILSPWKDMHKEMLSTETTKTKSEKTNKTWLQF